MASGVNPDEAERAYFGDDFAIESAQPPSAEAIAAAEQEPFEVVTIDPAEGESETPWAELARVRKRLVKAQRKAAAANRHVEALQMELADERTRHIADVAHVFALPLNAEVAGHSGVPLSDLPGMPVEVEGVLYIQTDDVSAWVDERWPS